MTREQGGRELDRPLRRRLRLRVLAPDQQLERDLQVRHHVVGLDLELAPQLGEPRVAVAAEKEDAVGVVNPRLVGVRRDELGVRTRRLLAMGGEVVAPRAPHLLHQVAPRLGDLRGQHRHPQEGEAGRDHEPGAVRREAGLHRERGEGQLELARLHEREGQVVEQRVQQLAVAGQAEVEALLQERDRRRVVARVERAEASQGPAGPAVGLERGERLEGGGRLLGALRLVEQSPQVPPALVPLGAQSERAPVRRDRLLGVPRVPGLPRAAGDRFEALGGPGLVSRTRGSGQGQEQKDRKEGEDRHEPRPAIIGPQGALGGVSEGDAGEPRRAASSAWKTAPARSASAWRPACA